MPESCPSSRPFQRAVHKTCKTSAHANDRRGMTLPSDNEVGVDIHIVGLGESLTRQGGQLRIRQEWEKRTYLTKIWVPAIEHGIYEEKKVSNEGDEQYKQILLPVSSSSTLMVVRRPPGQKRHASHGSRNPPDRSPVNRFLTKRVCKNKGETLGRRRGDERRRDEGEEWDDGLQAMLFLLL